MPHRGKDPHLLSLSDEITKKKEEKTGGKCFNTKKKKKKRIAQSPGYVIVRKKGKREFPLYSEKRTMWGTTASSRLKKNPQGKRRGRAFSLEEKKEIMRTEKPATKFLVRRYEESKKRKRGLVLPRGDGGGEEKGPKKRGADPRTILAMSTREKKGGREAIWTLIR